MIRSVPYQRLLVQISALWVLGSFKFTFPWTPVFVLGFEFRVC